MQWYYALSIMASIALADSVMLWALRDSTPGSVGPAHLLHGELGVRAPGSVLAAPIAASLILLAVVVLAVELFRLWHQFVQRRARRTPADEAPTLSQPEGAA